MTFYAQYPPAMYAAYPSPMPYPGGDSSDYYYPPASAPAPVYYDQRGGWNSSYRGNNPRKFGYNNRKVSSDSGISTVSSMSAASSSFETDDGSTIDEESSAPYAAPDEELCEKIAEQVEFYFSDANITKDKFLLKHVRRNKEGFVSLKLVASFKRVKHLTRDWRQVTEAVERKAERLEVNAARTKVRRTDALPKYDETAPSRTVVAVNLPLERPTIEGVAEIFSACGEIMLIRILRQGNPIPNDIRPFLNRHPEMSDKVCAVVEFELTEFAHRAVRELNELNSVEGKMLVVELTEPAKKLQLIKKAAAVEVVKKPEPRRRFSHAGLVVVPHRQHPDDLFFGPRASNAGCIPGAIVAGAPPRRRISLYHDMKFSAVNEVHNEDDGGDDSSALNPNAPTFRCTQTLSNRRTGAAASGLSLPSNVIRLPRGPEGKGFQHRDEIRQNWRKKVSAAASVAAATVKPKVTFAESVVAAEGGAEAAAADDDSGNEEEFVDVDLSENERER